MSTSTNTRFTKTLYDFKYLNHDIFIDCNNSKKISSIEPQQKLRIKPNTKLDKTENKINLTKSYLSSI